MKIPEGHTLVVNPNYKEQKNMKSHLFGSARRNPGARDVAMTIGEGIGLGLVAASVNYGVMKLATPPADPTKKAMLRGHAVGLSQIGLGAVVGGLVDQFTGRRDVAVGLATGMSALGIRDEWSYMIAQKAAAALAAANPPPAGQQPPASGGATGFSRGLPSGVVVPANPFMSYYK